MKCQIYIYGQIGGNLKLRSALDNGTARNGMFNSFHIYFDTIGEAKRAIREAHQYMKRNDCDSRKAKDNTALYYDASQANLIKL